ncbi:MAG: MotA/TolQ/ExbB proton channel family protein [candidate division KSB1 bacterium]|nr:MotA/TolQ/ExbB proton channel family protein [candidate division KSB1 bacterium]
MVRRDFCMLMMILLIMGSFLVSSGLGQTAGNVPQTIPAQSESPDTSQVAGSLMSSQSQPEAESSSTTVAASTAPLGFNRETLWRLVDAAGEIGILIIAVLALGIFLIALKLFQLLEDVKNSRWVLQQIEETKLEEMDKLISRLKQAHETYETASSKRFVNAMLSKVGSLHKKIAKLFRRSVTEVDQEKAARTSVFKLFSKLFEVFKSSQATEGFSDEVSSYREALKTQFNPFQTWMAFFSDTAGALGLLGTVWGMFLVFFRGSMEQREILSGMGIALATTILGLVVSIILNLCTSGVSHVFDNHLNTITKMADHLQLRLMKLGEQPVVHRRWVPEVERIVVEAPVEVEEKPGEPVKEVVPGEKFRPQKKMRRPYDIKVKSGQNQTGVVTKELKEPLVVLVEDEDGVGLEGVTVQFMVEGDGGKLANGMAIEMVETKEGSGGVAKTRWILGESAGLKFVTATVVGLRGKEARFMATALPAEPVHFSDSGNYQVGRLGEELAEPFVVRVTDGFGNPVSGVTVTFEIEDGDGRFRGTDGRFPEGKGAKCPVKTNEEGLAKVHFVLGKTPGATRVAAMSDTMRDKIVFQVFGK